MNRRSFVTLLAGLPLVGRLFAAEPEQPQVRWQGYSSEKPLPSYGRCYAMDLDIPPGRYIECTFIGCRFTPHLRQEFVSCRFLNATGLPINNLMGGEVFFDVAEAGLMFERLDCYGRGMPRFYRDKDGWLIPSVEYYEWHGPLGDQHTSSFDKAIAAQGNGD